MGSWSFNQNFHGVADDFLEESLGFDDALKLFDFPLEPVEENVVVENWDAELKGLELPLPDALESLSATFCPQSYNESKKISISNKYSQLKHEITGARRSSLHQNDSSSKKGTSHVFQTSSPVSVLESNTSSSNSNANANPPVGHPAPFDPKINVPVKTRSKRPRSSIPKPYNLSSLYNVERIFNSGNTKPSPLAIKKCAHCEETKTPQWREGPTGRKTLCNACGVRYKKSLHPLGGKEGADFVEANRKCSHCEATKTPQWREGPKGPKTLCNACGVRYRSGRLFPEYRPLSSPSYIKSVHSNSHKKVAELRKKCSYGDGGVRAF